MNKVIIAHNRTDIQTALDAAKRYSADYMFQSPPNGLHTYGLAVLIAMFDSTDWILDCADEAALAVEALRMGVKNIRLNKANPAFTKLEDIAAQEGAKIHSEIHQAIDLHYESDIATAVKAFLDAKPT